MPDWKPIGPIIQDEGIHYLWVTDFENLRDEVHSDLPCSDLDSSAPSRLNIKQLTTDDGYIRINPRSVMFPEILKEYYDTSG